MSSQLPTPYVLSSRALLADLVENGATSDELVIIASGRDTTHASGMITDKLQADRSEALLLFGAWIGGAFAFVVGDLVVIAAVRDALRTTDLIALSGLTIGACGSGFIARLYFLKARKVIHKLLALRRVLLRWSP